MRGLTETIVMLSAAVLGIVWSASPAAASIVSQLTVPVRATVDVTHLPIGDGKVTTSAQIGSVYSCQTSFNGGGAFTNGPWIHSDGTWDRTSKVTVDGQVSWTPQLIVTESGTSRVISGNDLPDHTTGRFPIAASDDAYQYDRNPNAIASQSMRYTVPANPTVASQPTCLPMGAIGVMLTGSQFFNALDAAGHDAAAHEIQDTCGGHPEQRGAYHYHSLPDCLDDPGSGHSVLVGYALDSFGIYGHRGESGADLTNADLDACHGHTHAITWDGQTVEMYHYHATWEYPYTLGCFRGQYGTTTTPAPGVSTSTPTATPTATATSTPTRLPILALTTTPTPTQSVAPLGCQPRPRVQVQVTRTGDGRLRATVTAGSGSLTKVSFGAGQGIANAIVDVDGGPTGQQAPFQLTPPTGTASLSFTVRRITAGQPVMVGFVATDGCGDWPSFVAGGRDAF